MKAFNRWVEGYLPQLQGVSDRTLLVLKIHAIAEDALHHLLTFRLDVENSPLRRYRVGFGTLSAVALAGVPYKPLRDAFSHLTKARNEAAHAAGDPDFEKHVADFIAAVRRLPRGSEVVTSTDPVQVLKQAGEHAIFEIYSIAAEMWEE